MNHQPVLLISGSVLVAAALLFAQTPQTADSARPVPAPAFGGFGGGRGAGGWLTSRADAQRTASIKEDAVLTPESLARPGFALEWKRRLSASPLTSGVGGTGSTLNPSPLLLADSAGTLHAVEVDTGVLVWARQYPSAALPACALPAPPVRPVTLTQAATGHNGVRNMGRGPYVGGVGLPGAGVPAGLMEGGMGGPGGGPGRGPGFPGPGGPGATPGRGPGGPPPGGPGRGGIQTAWLIAPDGTLHNLGVMEGKEVRKPLSFLPRAAAVSDAMALGSVLYASTTNNCGGVPNGVWALDTAAEPPAAVQWKSGPDPVSGFAFSRSGDLFAAVGNRVVALDAKTLALKSAFTSPGVTFAASPLLFTWQGREMLAAPAQDGRVFLLDTKLPATPLAVTPPISNAKGRVQPALASWEDETRTRYLFLASGAAHESLVALKLAGDAAKPDLQKLWTTGDFGLPSAPIAVNGVVFALKPGTPNTPAVLYAWNASSGSELWNSGKALSSWVRSAPLWSSSAQVYVTTADGTLHAFGFAMDRH